MSSDQVIEDKRRRRRRENGDVKQPLRIVSSLGEGKLMDRFQSAVTEKNEKKKKSERSGKMRQIQREKREREMAKFKAEINALMEDDAQPLKPSEKMTTFVPKLKGTVKGKFEALEKKKQEGERKKAENERKRRNDKDFRERQRIEIELAKKKLQEAENGENDEEIQTNNSRPSGKKPGKLSTTNFEEMAKMKEENKRKKAELERKMKMDAERRAFKEINELKENESDEEVTKKKTSKRDKPRRLTTNFDEIARAHAEEQKRKADEGSKRRLEEEKQRFREAKMAAGEEIESDSNEVGSSEKISMKPSRLSSSFTKFDVLEKERMEDERRRIQERRKKLLDEEMKLFEQAKKKVTAEEESSDEDMDVKSNSIRKPRKLDSSLTKFDIVTQQELEEKRERIQKERSQLLEEEKKMFAEQRMKMESCSDSEEISNASDSINSNTGSERECEVEKSSRKKKLTKRRKKKKAETNGPSKLDRSKLKFDVLERQRMEKERWQIQEQRRKLLEEERKIFEEAKKQRIQGEGQETEEEEQEIEKTQAVIPSKLDYAKTRFDIMAQHKMDEERRRIRDERARLLKEEKALFEQEKRKIKEQEDDVDAGVEEEEELNRRKPNRLDKSFTEFDVLAKKKKEEERNKIMRESQMKLEEEKRMFREAKKMMEESEDDSDTAKTDTRRKPQKLSKIRTEFDVLERQRMEDDRSRAYKEKLQQLDDEKKLFAEAKKIQEEEESEDMSDEEIIPRHKPNAPNRLCSTLTNFEHTEKQRMEKQRIEAQEKKIKQMEEELTRFQEERKYMNDSDKEERSSIPSPQVKQPRPKKLSSSFTKFDELARMKQEEERRKMREKREMELAEERRMFKQERDAEAVDGSEDESGEINEPRLHRPISKLNVRQQMEAVLQAQREVEQKRIMETKFCRMTVEQQEMYLAREKRMQMLQEKLAQAEAEYDDGEYVSYSSEYTDEYSDDEPIYEEECNQESIPCNNIDSEMPQEMIRQDDSEEDEDESEEEDESSSQSISPTRDDMGTPGSNDSGYTGSPWFTETLSNITLSEGDPVRFDAVIHADPHPKVTWYFKNRVIRNSPDYQYMNKGTQYSLYMNESFYDDMGEYMCKAENSKGVATSKAMLTVIEKDE